ncbi:MAG: 4-hydroxy-tetrahydrodipicolinate synthase [Desulfovibrionaceae bacterium]|nr:4-hydroxy-tetrahydrodipicolinate synthase [Desulfovibrionaceae bacterium]
MQKKFHGAITALVTPFKDGKFDEQSYRALIDTQIASGIHGLVPCGSTGESATLSHAEHEEVIRVCVDQVKGRVPVLAGAGSNNTTEAIALTKIAKDAGADGALLITPYYNKPTQEGLYQHYAAVAKAVDLPLILYNVPGRTGCNMLPPVLGRLARDFPTIIGVKEATGSLAQGSEVIETCPKDFLVLSGDDFTALPLECIGGVGVISVSSNIVPKEMAQMCDAFEAGDLKTAVAIHHKLFALHKAMFIETNPVPVKKALALMGAIRDEVRLPLCTMTDAHIEDLKKVLASYKLI